MITPRQIRAARALLGWDSADLAEKAGLTRATLSNIENGLVQARVGTLEKLAHVFDQNCIEFTDYEGVRFKPQGIKIFEGPEHYDEFYEFLYAQLKEQGGDVRLSVVDEKLLSKFRKDPDLHRRRMKELVDRGDVTFRILATESNFVSTYAQYKWQPRQSAAPTSFYAFGDCLALISFTHARSPYVVVIQSGPIAEAYKQSFETIWATASTPEMRG
ncbi:MAG: helix-turn-helix transcriptional regulator [Bdellovibrionales bacterium]